MKHSVKKENTEVIRSLIVLILDCHILYKECIIIYIYVRHKLSTVYMATVTVTYVFAFIGKKIYVQMTSRVYQFIAR